MNKYANNWKKIAEQVKRANNYICERCKEPNYENLEVHHLDGNTLNNEPYNLVCLCRKCHLEAQKFVAFRNELEQMEFPFFYEPADWLMKHIEGYIEFRRRRIKENEETFRM